MANKTDKNQTTGIEWTNHTVNFWVGCNVLSAGCKNCYAMRQAARMGDGDAATGRRGFGNPTYAGVTQIVNGKPVWTGVINRGSDATWKRPYKLPPGLIFANSMSDFFHPAAEDAWRLQALAVMQDTPQHRYQILTKRPEEIAPFAARCALDRGPGFWFPDNVWIGATVENQDVVHRIDTLRGVNAAVLFLSCEPLIGEINDIYLAGIDWVIGGGESGPGARRCDPAWARILRDLCQHFGVPYFWKQWGKPENNPLFTHPQPGFTGAQWLAMHDTVGKGGSLIDGVAWKEWPACWQFDLLGG